MYYLNVKIMQKRQFYNNYKYFIERLEIYSNIKVKIKQSICHTYTITYCFDKKSFDINLK